MRLIQQTEDGGLRLTNFLDDDIPKYAILSHTWLSDTSEVTFNDVIEDNTRQKVSSFEKIRFCAEEAAKDGLEYSWVDTCCIDKSNAVELQEAITSMFSWYRNAAKCYVYLSDVSVTEDELTQQELWESAFRNSRWFTRGWTLQELLAPTSVEFFSVEGRRLGDRRSLEVVIHEITGIPYQALRGFDTTKFTMAERLSWAANRQTRRKEDKAYSMLGLCNVFMPLIYGEGTNAFTRLQEEIEKKHSEGTRQNDLLSRLPVVPQAAFNSLENQHASTCLPDTRVELLREITEWVDGHEKSCIFWLNGLAGTGKSTIARTMARVFHNRGSLGASFFFSRGGGDASQADRLFTSLAWQLAAKIPQVKAFISEAIMEQENIMDQSLRDQWDQLILKPLSMLSRKDPLSTIVIVLDALDECDSDRDIRIVLRLLASCKSLENIRLRVLISSRPDIAVRCSFYQLPLAERQVFVLHDIQPEIVDHDLGLFFQHSLTTIREERGFSEDWPGMHIIRALVKVSGGLFIWAATACRFIRDGRGLAMKRIHNLLSGRSTGLGPEVKLDEIYTIVLRDCIQKGGYNAEEKQEMCETLREVLGNIVILFSPLSVDSLSNLLPISASNIKETLADCHTILSIPREMHRPIRLHHPTFRDFLLDKNRCYDSQFWVDEKQAHKAMADNCVQLMLKMLKTDMCNLQSTGTLVKEIDPARIKERIPPELEYAGRYWAQHYRESGTRLHDGDLAHRFIQECFLHWLELMSLKKHVSEVAGILRMYQALLLADDNPRQYPFVQDARWFALYFQSIIEVAPLQTYCAAVAFCKPGNKVRRKFWSQMRRWIPDIRIAESTNDTMNRPFTGKTFFVNDIAFTPDGRQVASGSVVEAVRFWDVATKAKLGTLEGHKDKVSSVAISADGSKIVDGSDDGSVMIWDLNSKSLLHTLRGHSRWVNAVDISPDGKLVASGSMDETIRIWDAEKGQQLCIFEGNSSCINSVAFSPDGALIASGTTDRMVHVWDVVKRQVTMSLDGHSGAVNCVRFSPDGKRIISAADDMTLKLWETSGEQEHTTLKGHSQRIMSVKFSPNGHLIASGSQDRTIILWDASGSLLGTLQGHTSGINAVAFSPDSRLLVSASFNDELRLWDSRTGESRGELDQYVENDFAFLRERVEAARLEASTTEAETLKGHSSTISALVRSSNGQLIASGSSDTTIKIWTRDGAQRSQLQGHSDGVSHLEFSPDTHLLASASADKTTKIWNTNTGAEWHTLRGHSENVRLIRFSTDGRLLVSCSTDKTAILWDVGTGIMMARLESHTDTVNDVRFSPGLNRFIASGSADTMVKLWDVSTGRALRTLIGHSDTVNSVSFSSDGSLLVSSSADKTIRLWTTAGSICGVLKGHTLPVNSAAFSPDGTLVVSCSDDLKVRIWDWKNNFTRGVLEFTVAIRSVDFSKCGQYIETDRGVLAVGSFSVGSPFNSFDWAYALFVSKDWVRKAGENVLWLPDEYHATSVVAMEDTAVLGHSDGSVSFILF